MNIKLENCPFCGGGANSFVTGSPHDRLFVKVGCPECSIYFIDTVEYGSRFEVFEKALELAAKQWNNRVTGKQPLAKWIPREYDGYADGLPVWDLWECSHCGHEHSGTEDTLTAYCPDCGYGMYGGENHVGCDQ